MGVRVGGAATAVEIAEEVAGSGCCAAGVGDTVTPWWAW